MEPQPVPGGAAADPGSFRDPTGRVFLRNGQVLRALTATGLADWRAVAESRLAGSGKLIATEELDGPPQQLGLAGDWAAVLRHQPLPFVSYPYEWTFSMLRDAALFHLEVLAEALEDDLVVKDGTPFNVQFVGSRPVFIDVGSLERLRPGDLWVGYRQFCRQFLFPLMLRAWKGVPFQPWLRGDPEGPTPEDMWRLLGRRRLTPTGLLLVGLQARADRKLAERSEGLRQQLGRAGFDKGIIQANVRGLQRRVERLRWEPPVSAWSGYAADCSHVARHREAKVAFLQQALGATAPRRVVDLGANDGHFSRVAADAGAMVIAVDSDEAVLDHLYRRLRDAGDDRIQPVLADLAKPSPALGWRGKERQSLEARLRPDLVVAYAVVHHLTLGASIPFREVADWLAGFGCPLVLEMVDPNDPMARRLVANKRPDEVQPDYQPEIAHRLLEERFTVERRQDLAGGTRHLLLLRPRR